MSDDRDPNMSESDYAREAAEADCEHWCNCCGCPILDSDDDDFTCECGLHCSEECCAEDDD